MSEFQNRRMRRSLDRQLRMVNAHTKAMQQLHAGQGWQEQPYSWTQIRSELKRYQYLQTARWRRAKQRNEQQITEHYF